MESNKTAYNGRAQPFLSGRRSGVLITFSDSSSFIFNHIDFSYFRLYVLKVVKIAAELLYVGKG